MDLEKFQNDVYAVTGRLSSSLTKEDLPKLNNVCQQLIEMYKKNLVKIDIVPDFMLTVAFGTGFEAWSTIMPETIGLSPEYKGEFSTFAWINKSHWIASELETRGNTSKIEKNTMIHWFLNTETRFVLCC